MDAGRKSGQSLLNRRNFMKKVFSNIAAALAGLFIVISIFGEVLSFCCLDEEFFISEYEKMDTAEQVGHEPRRTDGLYKRAFRLLKG